MKHAQRDNDGGVPWEAHDSVWNLIRKVSTAWRRHIEQTTRPLGLTSQQAYALRLLAHKPGMTQTELESELHIEKSSVCSLINGLVDRNWAERRQHPEDARIRQIYMTSEGHAVNDEASAPIDAIRERSRDILTPEEEAILKLLLQKVLKAYQ